MQGSKRGNRVSGQQLEVLWEFFNTNRDIATSYNRSLEAKELSKKKWAEIAEMLNSQDEGAHKDGRAWSKYWIDYKGKLKAKVTSIRSSCRQTGDGPPFKGLSEIEKKFLQILGEDFGQGLPGIQDPLEPSVVVEVTESPVSESILDNLEVPQTLSAPSPPTVTLAPDITGVNPTTPSITRSPRRRYRRRGTPMGQEAARRALVRSSQLRTDAIVRVAEAMEKMTDVLIDLKNTAVKIERLLHAALPTTSAQDNVV